MNSKDCSKLASSLLEELIIARGLIKEICTERGITMPKASLDRMEAVIDTAKKEIND